MSWEKQLDVIEGKLWFEERGRGETYKAQAVLECSERFLVWFQIHDYRHVTVPFPDLAKVGKLKIVGDAPVSTRRVALAPRSPRQPDASAPKTFLKLCLRLLDPASDEKLHGYVFSTNLQVDGGQIYRLSFNDNNHEDSEGSFVEFAHIEEPFMVIAHEERVGAKSRQELELAPTLNREWPLDELYQQ